MDTVELKVDREFEISRTRQWPRQAADRIPGYASSSIGFEVFPTLNIFVLVTLIIGSTFERMTISVGGFSFYFSHMIMVVLLPFVAVSLAPIGRVFRLLGIFGLVSLVSFVPAVVVYGYEGRLGSVLQIIANISLMLTVVSVGSSMGIASMRRAVSSVTYLFALICIVQIVVFPSRSSASGERFLGFIRPVAFFTEPTWVALFAALLMAAALSLRLKLPTLLLGLIVLVVFTRSALIVVVACIVVAAFSWGSKKTVVVGMVAFTSVFSARFVVGAVQAKHRVEQTTSLDTRQLDIFAVKSANGGSLSWWGSEVLRVYDPVRSRLVPSTSNVLSFDLFWKLGIAGLIVLAVWCILIAWVLPRVSGASLKAKATVPAWIALALMPAVMQLNNAFGRPWLWALCGLLLCVINVCAKQFYELDGRQEFIMNSSSRKAN